jgi:hypothetical protein
MDEDDDLKLLIGDFQKLAVNIKRHVDALKPEERPENWKEVVNEIKHITELPEEDAVTTISTWSFTKLCNYVKLVKSIEKKLKEKDLIK